MRPALMIPVVLGVSISPLVVKGIVDQVNDIDATVATSVAAQALVNFDEENVYWNGLEIVSGATVPLGVAFSDEHQTSTFEESGTVSPTPTVVPTQGVMLESSERKAEPIEVVVEKIGLAAPIIAEGRTPEGLMDVPADNATVGWWQYGRRPGELGSAVLAGHYKIADGSPGVFFRLSELQIDDEIKVLNDKNEWQTFVIKDRQNYAEQDFPTKYVYANKDAKRLNLITCSGEYLPEKDDYSHRLVLYAVLKE